MVQTTKDRRKYVSLSEKEIEDTIKTELEKQPFAKIVLDSLD